MVRLDQGNLEVSQDWTGLAITSLQSSLYRFFQVNESIERIARPIGDSDRNDNRPLEL